MKGFVPTPDKLVDQMVDRLFRSGPPSREDLVLDPGCGDGAFLRGVIRWCSQTGCDLPRMVGIESEPGRAAAAREGLARYPKVEIRHSDFLLGSLVEHFDFIIGNPPYVPITGLDQEEKRLFKSRYQTARGRFDLYLLFFERGISLLKKGGRLVFVTPEKFLYVDTAKPLRKLLGTRQVEEIQLVDEASFGELVTYPTVTTIVNEAPKKRTIFISREGMELRGWIEGRGRSWMPLISGTREARSGSLVLEDVCRRVSCGVATGADSIFIRKLSSLSADLIPFAYPTIAGRELQMEDQVEKPRFAMLIPYTRAGRLMPEKDLGALGGYLSHPSVRKYLLARTCVQRKPWYAFHETPPLTEILTPKILCKDIGPKPHFWLDRKGDLVPRHSVYYIVPSNGSLIRPLLAYLNSEDASAWLFANCQRAANGFLRLQSSVLKRLPLPDLFRDLALDENGVQQRTLSIEASQSEPISVY